MKLSGFPSRTSGNESIKSNSSSKFALKNIFRRRRSSVLSSTIDSPVESLFEEPIIPVETVQERRDVYDFDTDDLSSIDSMFESYSSMSEPHFKAHEGYKTVLHQGRNLTKEWEMRYDTILCQFYYINKLDQSIRFDSPAEVLQF